MGFFDKVSEFTKNTVDKSKDLLEIANLNSEISKQKTEIQKSYTTIGEKYYNEIKESPAEDYKGYCDTIVAAEKRIVELNAEIEAIKNKEKAEEPSVQTEAPPVQPDVSAEQTETPAE